MRPPVNVLPVLVGLVGLLGLGGLGGLGGLATGVPLADASTRAAHAPAAVGAAVRPSVDECHDLTARQLQAAADVTKPVSCNRRHTTRAVAVFDLPAGIAFGTRAAVLASQKRCYPALRAASGAPTYDRLALSALDFSFFYPTKPQQRQGFRFVRCDLTLHNGAGVAPLPVNSDPLLRRGVPERFRRCNNDSSAFFPCSRPYRNRAVASFSLPGQAYPGDAAQRETAAQRCTELVGRSFEFYYYPTQPQWKSGYRAFTCLKGVD